MLKKIFSYLSTASPMKLVLVTTFFVLGGSVPSVYLLSLLFSQEYTFFSFTLSIVVPLMLNPPLIVIFMKLTTELEYFKKHLQEEIEKNKAQDIILYEQARFVLMGEMLANISHQWKQPLNTMSLSIFNLKNFENSQEKESEYLEIMEKNVAYLSSTIDDFMSFFDKRSSSEVKEVCVIIDEIKSIIKGRITSENIELSVNLNTECEDLKIASSLSQVLINLINNAAYALQGREKKKIALTFSAQEQGVEILCCDNGAGVEEAIRSKIFNPYFTTKHKTQGTGIGLYMSKEIICKFFCGEIQLLAQSEQTCFKIEIPYSEKCIVKGKR